MTMRSRTLTIGICLLIAFGCVRRTAVQNFGLTGQTKQQSPSPDTSLRAIFRDQTKGAFNPLSGDPRVGPLQLRLKNNPSESSARLELAAIYEGYRLYDEALEQYTEAFDLSRSEKAIFGIVRCDQALNRS